MSRSAVYRNSVRVSHIGLSESVDSDTQIGTVIVNFLVSSNKGPNANVALVVDTPAGRQLQSLYMYDLYGPISSLPGSPDLILTIVNFEHDENKRDSVLALVEYLEGASNKSFDDNNILEEALIVLERLPVVQEKITTTTLRGPRSGYVPHREVFEEVVTTMPVQRQSFDNDPGKLTPSDTQRGSQMSYISTPSAGRSFVYQRGPVRGGGSAYFS